MIHISLFGHVQVTHDNLVASEKPTPTIQALLAYVILERRDLVPREYIASLFCGDCDEARARGRLSTMVWRLRRVLEPPGIARGTYLITEPTTHIGFNWDSPHHIDAILFRDKAESALSQPVHLLQQATVDELVGILPLYRGELLEGFYFDWVLHERERLRHLYLESIAHLMRYFKAHSCYGQCIEYCQKILDLDPLREEIHREMMLLYTLAGQRIQALRQYEACRSTLEAELGIPPMEETHRLYHQIVMDETQSLFDQLREGNDQSDTQLPSGLPGQKQEDLQLHHVMHVIGEIREQISQVARSVERLLQSKGNELR